MPILLTELVSRVPTQVEAIVRRVRDQVRPQLQEALRAECRLVMRTPEESAQNRPGAEVPLEVAAGHPSVLDDVKFPNDFDRILLLGRYRGLLEQARNGTKGLLDLRDKLLQRPEPDKWVQASESNLRSVTDWASALLKVLDEHDPLTTVLAIRTDFLGVYEYDARDMLADEQTVNRASIRLYWGVIGLVSEWLGCSVEDLTVVVLTHELAHAYTQLGADIAGWRWPATAFAAAELGLKEGLAQYYTDRVLRRLGPRHGGALAAYEAMLPKQPEAYRTHERWVDEFSPEAVRRAMLEVRRWKEGKLADFNRRLEIAQEQLDPKAVI